MRLLFTSSAKTRVIKGGRTFVDTCPECGHRATFDEVEVSESYGVFWIDVVSSSERAFRCGRCGDTFDLADSAALPAAAPPALPDRAAAARAEAIRAVRAEEARAEAARAREAREVRLDDELAELKRRMGK